MKPNKVRNYNAHETERMLQVHGMALASFQSRAAAFVVDFLLAFALFMGLAFGVAWLATLLKVDIGDHMLKFDFQHWYSLIFLVLYFSLATYWGKGMTPGKRLLKIRIVSLTHEQLGFWQSIERALGYGASFLEFGFGFMQFFINTNRRTVHDRIAETIVVRVVKGA